MPHVLLTTSNTMADGPDGNEARDACCAALQWLSLGVPSDRCLPFHDTAQTMPYWLLMKSSSVSQVPSGVKSAEKPSVVLCSALAFSFPCVRSSCTLIFRDLNARVLGPVHLVRSNRASWAKTLGDRLSKKRKILKVPPCKLATAW